MVRLLSSYCTFLYGAVVVHLAWKFSPFGGEDSTKIAPTDPPGDIFDQPSGEMSSIRGKLADHVGDYVVLSTEGAVLVTSQGKESSYPHPPNR